MSQPRGCVQSSQQVYRGGSPGLRVCVSTGAVKAVSMDGRGAVVVLLLSACYCRRSWRTKFCLPRRGELGAHWRGSDGSRRSQPGTVRVRLADNLNLTPETVSEPCQPAPLRSALLARRVATSVAIIRFLQQRLSRQRSRAARWWRSSRRPRKSPAAGGLRVFHPLCPPPPPPCLRALHDAGLRVLASVRHTSDGDGLGRLMLPDIYFKPI